MGVYNNTLITTTDLEDRVSSLVEYLDALTWLDAESSSVEVSDVTYSGAKFTISGTNIEGFFGYNDSLAATATYLKKGDIYLSELGINTDSGLVGSVNIHSYTDEKCKIIAIDDTNSSRRGIEFILIDAKDSTKLIGYKVLLAETNHFADISDLVFENVSDASRQPYSYTNMFPYVADDGYIDFLAQAYFVNANIIKQFETDILRECSEVTLLSTVSLQYSNYLAIGAHCLAPLDNEEEEDE